MKDLHVHVHGTCVEICCSPDVCNLMYMYMYMCNGPRCVGCGVCVRGKSRTYKQRKTMGPRLAVIVSKCPRLKNVHKSNGRCLKKFKSNNKGNNRGEQ